MPTNIIFQRLILMPISDLMSVSIHLIPLNACKWDLSLILHIIYKKYTDIRRLIGLGLYMIMKREFIFNSGKNIAIKQVHNVLKSTGLDEWVVLLFVFFQPFCSLFWHLLFWLYYLLSGTQLKGKDIFKHFFNHLNKPEQLVAAFIFACKYSSSIFKAGCGDKSTYSLGKHSGDREADKLGKSAFHSFYTFFLHF